MKGLPVAVFPKAKGRGQGVSRASLHQGFAPIPRHPDSQNALRGVFLRPSHPPLDQPAKTRCRAVLARSRGIWGSGVMPLAACQTAVLPFVLVNRMLGGPSWAGRSPDLQDTKCLPGGVWPSPLGGLVSPLTLIKLKRIYVGVCETTKLAI